MTFPRDGWVEANGLRLHYLDWGNEGAPPVLLLHGLQDCAALWTTFAHSIRDRFHVVALDHRGHGDSPPADAYPLTGYVDETRDAIRMLGLDGATLIGHSAGSKNAWICISTYPGIAARLVITDMDPDSNNPGSAAMISRYKGEDDTYGSIGDVVARLRDRQPNASGEETQSNAEVMTKPTPDGRLTWKRSRDVVTMYERPDVWDALPRVEVPTLIVRGAESTLLRHDVAVRMRDAIPDCRLVEIEGGAHWVHLEQPTEYARVVGEFLAERG